MKRFAIWAVLISATAPLASAKVLVGIAVAEVADVASGVYLFRVESAVMAGAVTGKVAVLR